MPESHTKNSTRRPGGFARRLCEEWRRLGLPGGSDSRVVAAVSGGADSTALLLALDESIKSGKLSFELLVAHLDHGLRGEVGDSDARFVAGQATRLGYGLETGFADVGARARETGDNLEQAARRERYEFLGRAARSFGAGVVVTAHTLDDQAETVLLALVRGAGADGLGGMSPARTLDDKTPPVSLARPLLSWARRVDTEDYCRARGVEWRADALNEDERFARVRVRRKLLPLLETFNPGAARVLARTAELLREDSAALEAEAARLLAAASDETVEPFAEGGRHLAGDAQDVAGDAPPAAWPLRVDALAGAPPALRRRAIRLWLARGRGDLRRLESAHVAAVEKLLKGERGGRVAELPGGAAVLRRRRWLFFRPAAPGRAETAKPRSRGETG